MSLQFVDHVPDWLSLRGFGTSRVLRTSFLWMAFVPMAANCMSAMDGTVEFELFGASIPIRLSLPFQWKLFYWSSVALAMASGAFSLRCPRIVKDFVDYRDFAERGHGDVSLLDMMCSTYVIGNEDQALTLIQTVAHEYATDESATNVERALLGSEQDRIEQSIRLIRLRDGTQSDCWHQAIRLANSSRVLSRLFCAGLYSVGWALLGVILLQGAWSVITQTV